MANTYLEKTNPVAGSRQKGTISFWVKRGKLGSSEFLYVEELNSTDNGVVYFSGGNTFNFINYNGGSPDAQLSTNRLFRDTSAWYHIVIAWDTTQGTAADRIKMYINGEQETSFSTATYPSLNANLKFGIGSPGGSNYDINIGRRASGDYFTGSITHFHRVDNQQLDASVFGETDANGVWKIKTSPTITYTGSSSFNFFILKNGNSVTDQSGEGNNLTVGGGTLTKTEDSPSNVFATLNPLNANIGATIPTLSMGNNRTSNSIINKMQTQYSTIAPSTGKFYCEVKATAGSVFRIGISSYNSNQAQGSSDTQNRPGQFSEGWGYDKTGTVYKNESSVGSYTAYNTGDIICIALDMTNKKLYFKRDANAWENSANPATGSNGIDISSIPSGTGMAFGAGLESGSVGAAYADFNFGNGYFGTTAVSSAGTNASGIGIFEYDVPTGYTALSTKGLNL
jgi:hypothetical protein